MRHSANLDILRSFAVTAVIIEHLVDALNSNTAFSNPSITMFTNGLGAAGVAAFFVHTCLVLMYSLERLTHDGKHVTLRFYIRRFFRIYPLSVFCVIMAVLLHIPNWPRLDAAEITPRIIVANLLLVQNIFTKTSVIGPLWSLAYEVQMYLVLPALYFLTLTKRSTLYVFGLFLVFCGIGAALELQTGHGNLSAYIPSFLFGVLCYTLRDRIRQFIPYALWPVFVVLLFAGLRIVDHHTGPRFWTGWIFCLILGLTINAFHDSKNKFISLIAGRVAMYSYGIYLIHVPMLYLVFMVFGMQNLLLAIPLFLVLTMVASIITYHLIEAPLINVGRRVSSHPVQTPALASTK
jgi:peptidoglycan/LPS O-acetylase OafA/YrhL